MRNIDIKMKLKLIVGLIGVLSLSSFSTLPSSDDTDKKEQENWVIGPFHRPEGVNPVLTPQPTSFYCPMRKEQVKWEESDIFNPAATVKDGKIVGSIVLKITRHKASGRELPVSGMLKAWME